MKAVDRVGFVCILILACHSWPANCQVFPSGFTREALTANIFQATSMAVAPDGRIFINQQAGAVRVFKNGSLLTTPFVSLTVDSNGERGLIGIAIDPNFAVNGFIYLYYTVPGSPAHNRISRFTADGDVALAGSEQIILELDPLGVQNVHNGGAMIFGHDNKLYVGVGENSNEPLAQNLDTYHGKVLRLNPDGSAPPDNPFSGNDHRTRFWGIGVRNPFAFSINRLDGRIFLIDVGANSYEEINDVTASGKNFGWFPAEGNSTNPAHTNPVYTYPHGTGDGVGCAITGSAFFTPTETNYPSGYFNKFFFVDFCEQWINTIDPVVSPAVASPFATTISSAPLYLTTGVDGNLYYLSRPGPLYRIVYTGTTAPFIVGQPESLEIIEGGGATLSVEVMGSKPMTFQWWKGNEMVAGATAATYTIPAASVSQAGNYTVVITNAGGSLTSDVASLSVLAAPAIVNQPEGAEVVEGEGVSFTVEATGTNPIAYQWLKDGELIPGATADIFNIDEVELDDAGSYTVTLTNVVGSIASDAAILDVTTVTGLIDEERPSVCYPNPSLRSQAHINLFSASGGLAAIDIVDLSAKRRSTLEVTLHSGRNIVQLPVSDVPGGIYVVRVTQRNRTDFHRLVILD